MEKKSYKKQLRLPRRARVRAKISGTAARPRLSVYRSHQALYVQLIDDTTGRTLVARKTTGKNKAAAAALGAAIVKAATAKGIKQVVFDRGGFRYHGNIKVLAEAAREGGLKF